MRIGGDDTIETYALGNLPGQTLEDNFWLDTYRDELEINVVYDWIVKGDDEYSQKINITIATGELPDIMSVTATQMVQLAEKYRKDSDGSLQRKQYCMYNIF